MTAIGEYRHRVTLENPGDPVPDGDGGYTETSIPLDPPDWDCSIQAASTRDLESIGAGTVLSQATHLLKGRYHPGITTESRVLIGGSPQSYPNLVIADGAVAYWRLDEISGTVAKDIIGGATGTISGGVTLNQPGALLDGNRAMTFNGTGGVRSPSRNYPATLTVEAWVKGVASGWAAIVSNRIGGVYTVGHFMVAITPSLQAAFYHGPSDVVAGGPILNDGVWHHVVVITTVTMATVFVDGVQVATGPIARPIITEAFDIGNDDAGSLLTGSIDDVAIYHTALTPTQIAAHYTVGTKAPDRILNVVFVANRDNRNLETNLVCAEVVP
jgi:head-tail adaptor